MDAELPFRRSFHALVRCTNMPFIYIHVIYCTVLKFNQLIFLQIFTPGLFHLVVLL
jgi:hypothetical protein